MDGYEFEDFISNMFRRLGFDVEPTDYSNDGGIDLVATYNQPIFSGKYIIQCKNWTGPVGQPEVRDLYGVVMDQRANKGILITPSDYTQQAYDFASGKNIELINGPILKRLLAMDAETAHKNTQQSASFAFRDERYSYYQKAIEEEPKDVSNYLRMIEYLRNYVKEQPNEKCSEELFNDIIDWTDKLVNKCFKKTSKADDRAAAMEFKIEALIHTGHLAEATEALLKYDKFWIYGFGGHSSYLNDDSVRVYSRNCLQSWNLFVAFKYINYTRGCDLLISKLKWDDIFFGDIIVNDQNVNFNTSMMDGLFVYPTPKMDTHLEMLIFRFKDRKNPSFFFEQFYTKSSEQYAQEIDKVFKLNGLL